MTRGGGGARAAGQGNGACICDKKRMSNGNRSFAITHSPLSSAVRTGLEPVTSCVTGRHSNQLN